MWLAPSNRMTERGEADHDPIDSGHAEGSLFAILCSEPQEFTRELRSAAAAESER